MNPMDNPVGEANIAFLEEVLKQMEQNTASQEVKMSGIKFNSKLQKSRTN